MISFLAMREDLGLPRIIQKWKYNIKFRREHPFYFRPDGLLMFVGPQGSGKTLSAVNYVYRLLELYPKCILVSNITLTDYPVDNERVFYFENADDLMKYSNGEFGVIFLIDEIQLYFNSLQSKNINIDVMTQISQQRKQRKHIVGTSQVFGRIAKPLREQFSNIVLCKAFFNTLQKNMLIDRDSIDSEESTGTNITGKVVKSFWYIRGPKMFKRYDTYAIINNPNLEVSVEKQDIYGLNGGVINGN